MEDIHGIDVSWIHNTHNKDRIRHLKSSPSTPTSRQSPSTSNSDQKILHGGAETLQENVSQKSSELLTAPPKSIAPQPSFSRCISPEKASAIHAEIVKAGYTSPGTGKRSTWLSSFSSKFSSSPSSPPTNNNPTPKQSSSAASSPRSQGPNSARTVVLPHAVGKPDSAAPYTPAPPKVAQPSFLQSALRRLSSSSGQLSGTGKGGNYGLCDRKVLNINHNRERCQISELDQSKLRRVAFCVDVEIASGPRYTDDNVEERKTGKTQKKFIEKGEGKALKHPKAIGDEREDDDAVKVDGEALPRVAGSDMAEASSGVPLEQPSEKDGSKKKEKKKRSEEERKARKEKKRKQAEANGILPIEVIWNGGDSSPANTPLGTVPGTPKIQAAPTTDPLRIYRRCCQLRETPILKKITDQLSSPTNYGVDKGGVVTKLDLSDYGLQLSDIVTLADFFAVVPIKELVMENCGLIDEAVRIILAGLLTTRASEFPMRKKKKCGKGDIKDRTGGVVERLVLKNNPKIGREGWQYICLFLNISKSIKCVDLSMIPFPQTPVSVNISENLSRTTSNNSVYIDTAILLAKSIAEKIGGPKFELLNMAETGLSTDQLGELIDGICKSTIRRLGLAGNNIAAEGMEHVARYLKCGKCEGLDLGGNDIRSYLGMIADCLDENHPLWILSLSNCGLNPESLWGLFPALAKLKNFRFIDLSHNHELFGTEPSALSLLRRYLPRMPILKRIHLTDVSMTPEQAIALAEILPEIPLLAHVNILENPQLSALANALDEVSQEEACALYASLMAAVRVSSSIICIDVDVPSAKSSEVVKALAKQVVAYCLRNMERGPVAEFSEASSTNTESTGGEREVAVPEVLLHLVGHVEEHRENHDSDEPAPDEDYVIGGTGVVKALGVCLRNRLDDSSRPLGDRENLDFETSRGTNAPVTPVCGGKAKNMSKNLLGSARKIRERLQPALLREANGDHMACMRLAFLDQTLERMIKRFEDEYPETRLPDPIAPPHVPEAENSVPSHGLSNSGSGADGQGSDIEHAHADLRLSDDECIHPVLSRHNSDVSLASKALSQEEGRMHRFSQQIRRDILRAESQDDGRGTTAGGLQAPHLEILGAMIEELGGDEIRRKVESGGQEAVIPKLNDQASLLRQKIIDSDPEGWEKFKEAQEVAERNSRANRAAGARMGASDME